MPRLAENALVKKTMTKVVNCTKKYRKSVRKSMKAYAKFRRLARVDTNYDKKTTKKASADMMKLQLKEKKDREDCEKSVITLEDMDDDGKIVKQETKVKVANLLAKYNADARDWSSNTSSDVANMKVDEETY